MGAPEELQVLMYERRYREAVDLIMQVRNRDTRIEHSGEIRWAITRASDKVGQHANDLVKSLLRCLEEGTSLAVPHTYPNDYSLTTSITAHPARLLLDLGHHYDSCASFLVGQERLTKQACRSVMTR